MACNKLAETRAANDDPVQVSTGSPAHSASLLVVCALYGKVSRNKSAQRCLAKCSSKLMRLAKINRWLSIPRLIASFFKFFEALG